MKKKAEIQIEGQISLFDMIEEKQAKEPELIDIVKQIEDREILKGSGFEKGKTRIYNFFKEKHTEKERVDFLKKEYGIGGWSIPEGIADHNASGIDIKFDKPIGKTSAVHIGWPMVAIKITRLIAEGKYEPDILSPAEQWEKDTGFSDYWQHDIEFVNDKPVCKHSKHSCNRKELWNIAHTLDYIECPEVCCRQCKTIGCGARCNGSEEPKDKVKCQKAAECEAYPKACTGTMDPCRCGGPFKWSEKNTPKEVIVKGFMDDGYCPTCDACLNDLVEKCPYCTQKLSWEHWKKVNQD